jgi:hypothetical protein
MCAGVDMFSLIAETALEENKPKGISFSDIETILQRKERYGDALLTAEETEVLASLSAEMSHALHSRVPRAPAAPPSPLPSPTPQKFAGFSFEHNIEELLQRRAHHGVDSLTSIELEALQYHEQQQAKKAVIATPTHAATATTSTSATGSFMSDESPFSRQIQDLLAGLSLSVDNFLSHDTPAPASTRTDQEHLISAVPGASDGRPVHLSDDHVRMLLSSFERSVSTEEAAARGDSHSAAASSLQERTFKPSISLEDSPFSGFSFSDNIMELIERRELHGEDSLTSIEKEALEYYADVIIECTARPEESPQRQMEDHYEEFTEHSIFTPSRPAVSMSVSDARHVRSATQSIHNLLESVKTKTSQFSSPAPAPAEGDESDISAVVSPMENYIIEAIRARVVAEKLMSDTSVLLEDESDVLREEADEIMRRVEAEREQEVQAILMRMAHDEEGVQEVEAGDDDDEVDKEESGDEEEEEEVEVEEVDNREVIASYQRDFMSAAVDEEPEAGAERSSGSSSSTNDGEVALWFQHMKANDDGK